MTTHATVSKSAEAGQQQAMLASQRAKESQPQEQHQQQRQQEQQETGESRRRGRLSMMFPLGYKEAASQWWTSVSAAAAERNVLSYVPFLKEATATTSSPSSPEASGSDSGADATPDPYGRRVWRKQLVQLSGKDRALNEYSVERVGEEVDDTLVMLHGYGAGLGFFYKNFEPLTRVKGWRLYALDMLGMGNSSRPSFRVHAKDPQARITEAENWFVDSLEEWRRIRKIERFTLLGHSLGGYLAVSYALKYPGRLNKLILASPVGIPEDPYAVNAAMPEPEESTMASEFTQDQESIVENNNNKKSGGGSGTNNNTINNNNNNTMSKKKPERRPLPGWLVWLWDANVSPFSIVRASGPLGPRLVSGWTSRRFNHLPPDESQALHTYSYSLFRQKGSGEYALPYLLAPGAYARSPVINRIQDVGRQVIPPAVASSLSSSSLAAASAPSAPSSSSVDGAGQLRETGYPIVMMYGDNDWMDVAGGFAAEEKIRQRVVRALLQGTEEEKRRENGSAKVVIVRRAGHHLYLDNPDEFNEYMRRELEETREWGLKQRALAAK